MIKKANYAKSHLSDRYPDKRYYTIVIIFMSINLLSQSTSRYFGAKITLQGFLFNTIQSTISGNSIDYL